MHKQTRGSVRLREWMERTKTKQKDLGAQLETHQTNVSALLQGRPCPLSLAVRLKKIAKIPVEDWLIAAEPADESTPDVTANRVAS